jgi:REP element-mobilizing transposase RayT
VAHNRLPVFRTDKIKTVIAAALNEARESGGFSIFAYAVMPDHYHLITDSSRQPSETRRFANGITARHVVDYLKTNNFAASLEKLKQETKKREYKYSLWEHHPNAFLITGESTLMQKVKNEWVHEIN